MNSEEHPVMQLFARLSGLEAEVGLRWVRRRRDDFGGFTLDDKTTRWQVYEF